MYLSDRDITALLPELNIETGHPSHAFDAPAQIQPCSIDIRLDAVFWEQRRRTTLDLRKARLLELSPRRYWRRKELQPHESFTLQPGAMVLGRTYEKFSIPTTCAGKIEGRSSFARLGLAVHCSGDFINPGWRGHMPLQLINHGTHTIRLFPYIPICQVLLVKLSSTPERVYGDRTLSSKYLDDDGGPSYWWRDKFIQRLQRALGEHDVELHVQDELFQHLGPCDPELLERFERFVRRATSTTRGNADDLLASFSHDEDRRDFRHRAIRALLVGAGPTLLAASIGSVFSQPFGQTTYTWLHYILWAATALAIPASLMAYRHETGEYLTKKRLQDAYHRHAQAAKEPQPRT
jgi:deoxycytidine triphosphate deaminase